MKKFLVFFAALTLFIAAQAIDATAAWGDYDPTFGNGGIAQFVNTNYNLHSVAIQPDGKILVTGHRTSQTTGPRFILRRYLSNANLDTAFGNVGSAIGPESNNQSTDHRGYSIVIHDDGRIAVAGVANGNYAVWQFNADGSRDVGFGTNGLQVLTAYPVIGSTVPEANLQGRKLVLSLPKSVSGTNRRVLVRLGITGALDTTFGTAGESLSIYSVSSINGTVVETSGKLTVGGLVHNNLGQKGLDRKTLTGLNDPTFFPAQIGAFGHPTNGLVKMGNGKYVLRGGHPSASGLPTMILEKFSATGSHQSNLILFNGFPTGSCPSLLDSQSDGKLIASYSGMLFRTDNELTSGSVESNTCPNLAFMTGLSRAAIQPDDKMVVAGLSSGFLTLVRLLPN